MSFIKTICQPVCAKKERERERMRGRERNIGGKKVAVVDSVKDRRKLSRIPPTHQERFFVVCLSFLFSPVGQVDDDPR
jgi:hypothetical protein